MFSDLHIKKQETLVLSRSFVKSFNARKLEGAAVALSRRPLMKFDIQRVRRFCLRADGRPAAAGDWLRGGLLAEEQCRSYPGKG